MDINNILVQIVEKYINLHQIVCKYISHKITQNIFKSYIIVWKNINTGVVVHILKSAIGFANGSASTMTATCAHAYHYAPHFLLTGMESRQQGGEWREGKRGVYPGSIKSTGMAK